MRFVTVSPGSTSGTDVAENLPLFMKIMFKYVGPAILPVLGLMHDVEKGAERYVKGLFDESYLSGKFYASKKSVATGPLVDQSEISRDFAEESFQDYHALLDYV